MSAKRPHWTTLSSLTADFLWTASKVFYLLFIILLNFSISTLSVLSGSRVTRTATI